MSEQSEIKKTKFRSLTVNLTVTFFVLSASIFLIIGGLSLYFNFITQQKLIAEQQHHIAHDVASAVADFIEEKFSLLESAVSIDDLATVHQEEQKNVLSKLLGVEPAFRQLILLNAQGQELVVVSRLSSSVSGKLKERTGSDIFSQVSQGKTYIGSVYVDETTSEPLITIAVSAKNVFGDFKGVLMAEVNLKFMWDLVGGIKIGENGLAYVVDKQGNLIAFGDVSRVLKEENLIQLEEVSEFAHSSEALDTNVAVISNGIEGTYVATTFVPLRMPDWAAIIELPILEAYQPVIYQITLSVLILFLIFGLAIVAVVLLSKRITKPIKELMVTAQTIAGGDLTKRAEIKSKDEIGQLAAAFNKMVENVLGLEKEKWLLAEKQKKELERAVEEKTTELQSKVKDLGEARLILQSLAEDIQEEKEVVEVKVKARTRELSEEHVKIFSLIESIRLGVVMVDLSLNVILANPAAKTILGKPLSEVLAFKDLDEKIKDIKISQALSYYIQAGQPLNIQEVLIEGRYFRLFMSPVRDAAEKIFIGAVIIMEDITEQKKLDKMRTEIVSITSHQLRTPSAVIKGNLEMVLEGDVGEVTKEQREILNEAFLGNERMIKLINDLMDVSKIDEGRFELKLEPCQLEDLVAEIINEVSPLAKEKHVSLSFFSPSAPLPKVKIDRLRLKQVLQNLIENAVKYSHIDSKGKVSVEIQKEEQFLKVVIKDNGIGIPRGEQEKMFERFFRGSNVTKLDPGGGSGLGLYIAKAIIEQSGGKIWFVSEEGKGTTFFVTLRLG